MRLVEPLHVGPEYIESDICHPYFAGRKKSDVIHLSADTSILESRTWVQYQEVEKRAAVVQPDLDTYLETSLLQWDLTTYTDGY